MLSPETPADSAPGSSCLVCSSLASIRNRTHHCCYTLFFRTYFFLIFIYMYLFDCARSQLQHVESISLTRDLTQAPCNWEHRILDTAPPGKSSSLFLKDSIQGLKHCSAHKVLMCHHSEDSGVQSCAWSGVLNECASQVYLTALQEGLKAGRAVPEASKQENHPLVLWSICVPRYAAKLLALFGEGFLGTIKPGTDTEDHVIVSLEKGS